MRNLNCSVTDYDSGVIVNEKFAELGSPRRIWAVAAVHGELDRLALLHDHLADRFTTRDRVVYLGNYLDIDTRNGSEIFDELLAFRSALLSKSGVEPSDIVYLRGPTEEAWLRLLRLQFAPMPTAMLEKLSASGVEAYLRLYGISINDTKSVARAGSMAITRYTNHLRAQQRLFAGHEQMFSGMRRAALGAVQADDKRILFVPSGFDSTRRLDDQAESLWWSTAPYGAAGRSLVDYNRLVRGFDSVNGGAVLNEFGVTLDGGAGRGGPLMCGCFTPTGHLIEVVAIGGRGVVETPTFERSIANDVHDAPLRSNMQPVEKISPAILHEQQPVLRVAV